MKDKLNSPINITITAGTIATTEIAKNALPVGSFLGLTLFSSLFISFPYKKPARLSNPAADVVYYNSRAMQLSPRLLSA